MALDVYFVRDIRNALTAALIMAVETAVASGQPNTDHLGGAVTMARAMAANFGSPWAFVVSDARLSLGDGLGGLLDAPAVGVLEGGDRGR